MPVEVVVLEANSARLLGRWPLRGHEPRPDESWSELIRQRGTSNGAVEVFLCFSGAPFENYDHRLIESQLRGFRQLAPTAALHVVHHALTAPVDPTFDCDAIERWYETAWRAGLEDLLEFPLDADATTFLRLVRAACDRAAARRQVIDRYRDLRPWPAVLADRDPAAGPRSEAVLDPYVRYGLSNGGAEPVVIIVPGGEQRDQKHLAERVLSEHQPKRAIVALLNGSASDDLKALCQREAMEWLPFRGFFELRYFLLRMNEQAVASLVDGESKKGRPDDDAYGRYERACGCLRQAIEGDGVPAEVREEFWSFEHRLFHEIDQLRRFGGEKAEFNRVVELLNGVSSAVLGQSFNSLVRSTADSR